MYWYIQNFMTGCRLHTHKILISFQEWIYRVRFLTGWNSGSQPNVSLGPEQRFLKPWLSYIQSSRLLPNQWYRTLMESTEPFFSLPLSAFHIQFLWTFSRCYSCCVFSRLGHFFFSWVSNLFIPLPKYIFLLCLSQRLCFPLIAVAPILVWRLTIPCLHSHHHFLVLTRSPFVSTWRTNFLAWLSFHQQW